MAGLRRVARPGSRGPVPRPVLDRVADHTIIDEETGCHLWTGSLNLRGRPQMQMGSAADGTRRPRAVHWLVWEAHNGERPGGFDVHHRCEEIHCVNIEHLELLPHGEHSREHHRRGRITGFITGYALHVRWHVNRGVRGPRCEFC